MLTSMAIIAIISNIFLELLFHIVHLYLSNYLCEETYANVTLNIDQQQQRPNEWIQIVISYQVLLLLSPANFILFALFVSEQFFFIAEWN